jgi:hypothetical protein
LRRGCQRRNRLSHICRHGHGDGHGRVRLPCQGGRDCRRDQHHARCIAEVRLGRWLGFWWRLESLKFQLPVLQGLYEAFNDSAAPGYLGLVRRTKFEVSIGLEFLRSFAERVAQALAKLQLGFALRGIPIRKTFLTEVIDRGQHFLKLRDSACGLFNQSGFRSGPLMFCCACSCHGCVKKV